MSLAEKASVEKKLKFKEKNVNEQNVVLESNGSYIEILHPKGWEARWFEKQQEAVEAYEDMMAGAELPGQAPQRLEELKKVWLDKKREVMEAEKHVPPRIVKEYAEQGATRNKESIQQALDKIKEEGRKLSESKVRIAREVEVAKEEAPPAPPPEEKAKPAEAVPNTSEPAVPKGQEMPSPDEKSKAWMGTFDTWTGGKVPDTVTTERLRRYVESVGRSQGKNTLAYAYAESLFKNAQNNAKEKPIRQEAEKNRNEYARLEEEQSRLKEELAALDKMEEEGGIFQEPTDGAKSRLERKKAEVEKELQSQKKGWGASFAHGLKKLFGKFKKNYEKDYLQGLNEYGFFQKEEQSKVVSSENLNEYGFIEKKEEPATLNEALREDKVVPIEEPETAVKSMESSETTKVQPEPNEELTKKIDDAVAAFKTLEAQKEQISKREKEAIKGTTVRGWLDKMVGGLAKMNLKDMGKFLNLYSEAKNIAREAKAQTELIRPEEGRLDFEEAWKEAQEVEKDRIFWNKRNGGEPLSDFSSKITENTSMRLSFRKVELNRANEDRVVLLSLQKLQKEYAATHQGKELAPERMALVEQKLREEIGKLRKGQIRKSFFDFAKLFKESLDDKRWSATVDTIEKVSNVKL